MSVREALGRGLGGLWAPVAAEASLVRGARLFHPYGMVLDAEVRALPEGGALGAALEGPAIARFSGAIFRDDAGRAWPDILGLALRFHPGKGAEPAPGAQDLLLATFRSVWMLPFAMLLTHPGSYLANVYDSVLPSSVPGRAGAVTFRVVPEPVREEGRTRRERLENAVAEGRASLHLEMRPAAGPRPAVPIATIALLAPSDVDQEALRFDPSRAGAGIVPTGFFQAVRAAIYPAGQLGRGVANGPGRGGRG
jgi:hypothetical protein